MDNPLQRNGRAGSTFLIHHAAVDESSTNGGASKERRCRGVIGMLPLTADERVCRIGTYFSNFLTARRAKIQVNFLVVSALVTYAPAASHDMMLLSEIKPMEIEPTAQEIEKEPSRTELPPERLHLTPNESFVLFGVAQGLRNKEIALRAGIPEQAVKNRLKQVFDKVGVDSRLELALYCSRNRVLEGSTVQAIRRERASLTPREIVKQAIWGNNGQGGQAATPSSVESDPLGDVNSVVDRPASETGETGRIPLKRVLQTKVEPEIAKVAPATVPAPTSGEVMKIRQAAQYLQISPDTLYKMAGERKVPAFKLGNRWRFAKSVLDAWMTEKCRPPQTGPPEHGKGKAQRCLSSLPQRHRNA
jgi:excisionase family DNA binding protein